MKLDKFDIFIIIFAIIVISLIIVKGILEIYLVLNL